MASPNIFSVNWERPKIPYRKNVPSFGQTDIVPPTQARVGSILGNTPHISQRYSGTYEHWDDEQVKMVFKLSLLKR